jgi:hypothetical protein
MPVVFEPAKMEGVGLWVSISGGSRTGKTVSALRLAKGIAGNKPIFAIDTEGRRMSHHAKRFKFNVHNMTSPFHPLRFAEAAEAAQAAGAGAVVCDSFSLAWNGPGGLLDIFAAEWERRGGSDKQRDPAWAFAKDFYREMRDRMMQLHTPMIFCSRCNQIDKRHAGNVEGRWKVEGDQKWLYEWTVALTLRLPFVGRPAYDMMNKDGEPLYKVPDALISLFPPDRFIGEAAGEGLRAWRSGETPTLRDEDQPSQDVARDSTANVIAKLQSVATLDELAAYIAEPKLVGWREKLRTARPELASDILAAEREAYARLALPKKETKPDPADDDGGPGPDTTRVAA